jgi:copper chaperone
LSRGNLIKGGNMEYAITVENIKCGGCANSVRKGLLMNKKIRKVDINIETGGIRMEAESGLDLDSIRTDLKKLGYPEKGAGNDIVTRTKSFISCAIGRIGM